MIQGWETYLCILAILVLLMNITAALVWLVTWMGRKGDGKE